MVHLVQFHDSCQIHSKVMYKCILMKFLAFQTIVILFLFSCRGECYLTISTLLVNIVIEKLGNPWHPVPLVKTCH